MCLSLVKVRSIKSMETEYEMQIYRFRLHGFAFSKQNIDLALLNSFQATTDSFSFICTTSARIYWKQIHKLCVIKWWLRVLFLGICASNGYSQINFIYRRRVRNRKLIFFQAFEINDIFQRIIHSTWYYRCKNSSNWRTWRYWTIHWR